MISEEAKRFYELCIKNREKMPDLAKRDYTAITKANSENMKNIMYLEGVTLRQEIIDGISIEWAIVDETYDHWIYYIHGGGFVSGEPAWGRFCSGSIAKLCKRNVLSIDYALAPEHPFPAGINECGHIYRWMLEEKGIAPENIVFLGESAGGNLVLSCIHYAKQFTFPMPAAICAVSPVVDLRFPFKSYLERRDRECILAYNQNEEVWRTYLNVEEQTDPLASPICGDCTGFPPTYIQVSTEEMLYDDAIEMTKKLRESGVHCELREWEGMWHTFYMMDFPESRTAFREIATFFDRYSK